MGLEYVSHMRAAVVTAHLVAVAHADMGPVAGIVTFGVRIPTVILELGGGRIEGKFTRTASEISLFGKETAEFARAISLRAALPQDTELLRSQLRPPLRVCLPERVCTVAHCRCLAAHEI